MNEAQKRAQINYRSSPKGKAQIKATNRRATLKRAGFTPEMWDAYYYAQGGLCYLCGESNYSQGINIILAADHNHSTGQARGLLCNKCNSSLGFIDSISLALLIHYISG